MHINERPRVNRQTAPFTLTMSLSLLFMFLYLLRQVPQCSADFDTLVEWLQLRGAARGLENLELGISQRGRGLHVRRALRQGDLITSVRLDNAINCGSIVGGSSERSVTQMPVGYKGYLAAIHKLRQPAFAHYQSTLPRANQSCLLLECMTTSQIHQFQEPELAAVASRRKRSLRRVYSRLRKADPNLQWFELLDAHVAIQTRSFFLNVGQYHSESDHTHAYLLPVVDLLNTDFENVVNCNLQLIYDRETLMPAEVLITAKRDLEVGEELLLSYSSSFEKINARLITFGFVR